MPDETINPPAGAAAGQPASGSATPAAEPNKAGDAERQGLRERAIAAERKAADAEAKLKAADDAKLAEQGKFQELAKSKEAEASDWKAKHDGVQRSHAIFVAGIKAGANDPSDLEPFLAKVNAADPAELAAAVDALKPAKPYLFGTPNGKSGAPFPTPQANPGGTPEVKVPKGVKASDVANLTREQKQAIADSHFGGGASGGFFRK